MSKLFIIGVGPGSKDYLTEKAKNIVKSADVTIGSWRAINVFDDIGEVIGLDVKDLQEKLENAVDLAKNGKKVCVLSTGDPGFSGVLKTIKKIAENKNFDQNSIEVIPGISSLQLAAAKNRISWDEANIMTFHGRENISDILNVIDNGLPTIALPSKSVKDMAKFLLDNGVDENRKVTICEKLSYPEEKIITTSLKEVLTSDFSYMCVMIIY
ncbi:cobalt-precorrin-7 (C(5))-methyltransferase [Methanobrevibacter arboriphilus]|jgi:cobalt-precorrin-7 (C5)-methyltransferase|uniref:Cobalt-precorrin-7 (C(5))-methyltransferase n=1 Tax=Methanobrevibacter arboriphilus TaxID=39441 RepID=A0ACA8R3I1_METAZ|nr:cobalt-precorrin-7 (C(5))-methyltransferase [Methanobrevibacter arboriphilus]BBL62065.1 cobalt-precorrin-7 (C(5))-methyltransferase [Methanobrevibacter arboriphilus]GLI11184.1 cobalt-precorrin-7 (C(5))-methyltransferase [Methanobrevibacter arboriphilus]